MSITDVQVGSEVTTLGDAGAPVAGGRRQRREASRGLQLEPGLGTPGADRKPRRKPLTTTRGVVVWVFASIALLSLWFVAYAVALTPIEENHRQAVLYDTLREHLALETAPLGGAIPPGTPVALLSAPSLGIIDQVVVEGTASGDLMAGPGHRRDTVLPGQIGVAVLYGRASLFGGPFGSIEKARSGDTIDVTTGQGVFTYVIEAVRRAGDPFPKALAAGKGRLTLVSAEGKGRFGFLAPQAVVYVDATLRSEAQQTLPGKPTTVPKAEQAMQGDPSALLPLALMLPLLLGAILFLAWASTRWGGWQAWVIGVPVLVATLWAASQAAIQLLPNLL